MPTQPAFAFLQGLDADVRQSLLTALRTLWTHSSTALEGNTFTLGDTAFFLQEGLTIGGKSLREHEEIQGHARAIDALHVLVHGKASLTEAHIFALHTLVQTHSVLDVYAPVGAWKVEPNGTYAVGRDGKSLYVEYPLPQAIPGLMALWLRYFNSLMETNHTRQTAPAVFAAAHTSFVRIHPFADGNGRMARLLSNMPLLASGLPPLLIRGESRQAYISLLSQYDEEAGTLTTNAPLLPKTPALKRITEFCTKEWHSTWDEIDKAWAVQKRREQS